MGDETKGATGLMDAPTINREGERPVSRDATYHRSLAENYIDSKGKAPGAPFGFITGYASQFDVVDLAGDVVRPGAFTKTIAEQGGKVVLMAKHAALGGGLEDVVATVVELNEDEYGLRFRAHYHDDDVAQAVRAKIGQLMADGIKIGASIGYRILKWGYLKDETNGMMIRELNELALKEITITLIPANEGAFVLESKEDQTAAGSSGSDSGDGATKPPAAAEAAGSTEGTRNSTDGGEDTADTDEDASDARSTADGADEHSGKADAKAVRARIQALERKGLILHADIVTAENADEQE